MSEHFIYIENQFFITSTVVDGVTIHNGIGDALVNRIIRAHKEGTTWRACVVIPLLPGYTYPIDSNEGSSVRLIMECQNRTICRGTHSIFSRLKKEGIDPDDYITFFSLRGWAKFKSGVLTTEQVYIHGKTMIVDDRKFRVGQAEENRLTSGLVLCGSANINERSQRGDRDSELLAVIRDTDMIDGWVVVASDGTPWLMKRTMGGKPFKVGRFAHTLRIRLMREHMGVDVDAIEEDQLMSREPVAEADEVETWDPDHEQAGESDFEQGVTRIKARTARARLMKTFRSGVSAGERDSVQNQEKRLTVATKGMNENMKDNIGRTADKIIHPVSLIKHGEFAAIPEDFDDESERQDYGNDGERTEGFASSVVPTLEEKTIFERRPDAAHANGQPLFDLIDEGETGGEDGGPDEATVNPEVKKGVTVLDEDKDVSKRGVPRIRGSPDDEEEKYGAPSNAVKDDDAVPNEDTERDDETEKQRGAIAARKTLRKHLAAKVGSSPWSMPTPTPKINPNRFHDPLDETFWKDMWVATAVHNTEIFRKVFRCIPDDLVTTWAAYKAFANHAEKFNREPEEATNNAVEDPQKAYHGGSGTRGAGGGGSGGGVIGRGVEDDADSKAGKDGHDKVSSGVDHSANQIKDLSDGLHKSSKSPRAAHTQMAEEAPSAGGVTAGAENKREPSGPDSAWTQWEREEMEELLNEVRGHLGEYSFGC